MHALIFSFTREEVYLKIPRMVLSTSKYHREQYDKPFSVLHCTSIMRCDEMRCSYKRFATQYDAMRCDEI